MSDTHQPNSFTKKKFREELFLLIHILVVVFFHHQWKEKISQKLSVFLHQYYTQVNVRGGSAVCRSLAGSERHETRCRKHQVGTQAAAFSAVAQA